MMASWSAARAAPNAFEGPAGSASSMSDDAEVVVLRYSAPSGCPARDVIEAAVRSRAPKVRLAATARRVFAITIEAAPGGYRGALVVDDVADKALSAERCDDLATALALVTALAIDPSRAMSSSPALEPAPLGPEAGARVGPLPPSRFDLVAGGLVEGGVAPSAAYGAAIEARASRGPWQASAAVLAAQRSSTQMADSIAATTRFTWLAARVGGCARHLGLLELAACVDVEIGGVRARGEDIVNERALTRLWLATGIHGNAVVPLGARSFVQLQLGGAAPLVRDRYIFAPDVAIHETPNLTGWVSLGAGVRFR